MLAVETKGLSKNFVIYKSVLDRVRNKGIKIEALKSVNLEVKKGEIFGLLGPNGAGKTTLLNILSTLLLPDSGTAEVFGLDVTNQAEDVRKAIALCPGYAGFYDEQTVRENLEIFSMIYNSHANIKKIISMVWLDKLENMGYGELSSGNRQKVTIAKSLLSNAKIFLLDELTVGLDPEIALKVRKLITDWNRKHKTTIILSTHNMYEADAMCERVAIIHKGRIVACNTPENLKKIIKEEDCIEISVVESKNPSSFLSKLNGVKRVSFSNSRTTIHVDEAEERLDDIIKLLLSRHYHIKTVKVREPTLEDVFIKLVGVRLE